MLHIILLRFKKKDRNLFAFCSISHLEAVEMPYFSPNGILFCNKNLHSLLRPFMVLCELEALKGRIQQIHAIQAVRDREFSSSFVCP